jgi:hypothetical protein
MYEDIKPNLQEILNICNKQFGSVSKFKCLGTTVKNVNESHDEIWS